MEDPSDSIQDIVHLPPGKTYMVGHFNNGQALAVLEIPTDNSGKVRYMIRTVGEDFQYAIGNIAFELNWRSVEREALRPERLLRLIVELKPQIKPSG